MRYYEVQVEITVRGTTIVEAADEADAKEKALEQVTFPATFELSAYEFKSVREDT